MKKTIFTPKQVSYQKHLLKRFHTLIRKTPDPVAAKESILLSFNVVSSKSLTIDQLKAVCDQLENKVNPQAAEMDKLRKGLMASIGGWLECMNRISNADIIKGIACRASGKASFNQIPKEQLRSLYYAFKKKQEDMQSVEQLTEIELGYLSIAN